MFVTRTGEITVLVKSYSLLAKALRHYRKNGMDSAIWKPATVSAISTSS